MKTLKRIEQFGFIQEERVYGHEEIRKMQSELGPDEYVHLDDTTGTLSGEKVSKQEYVKRMLKTAMSQKDWSKVSDAIRFIESQA